MTIAMTMTMTMIAMVLQVQVGKNQNNNKQNKNSLHHVMHTIYRTNHIYPNKTYLAEILE